MRRPRILTIAVLVLVVFLYAPLIVVILFAFNGGNNLSWPIHSLSLHWFHVLLSDPSFSSAFYMSVRVSTSVAVIAAVIGTAASIAFVRRRMPLTTALEGLSRLCVMLPPLFLAIGLFTAMDLFNITPGFATIVVGQLLYVIPYVLVVVTARLMGFDLELEQVARDLGAGPLQALRRITFRIVAPAILGAAILAFAFSFDEVLITNFTAGEQATLPLYVFSKLRRTVDPTVNAVATVLIVIPWIALGVAWFIVRTRGFGENRSRSTLA